MSCLWSIIASFQKRMLCVDKCNAVGGDTTKPKLIGEGHKQCHKTKVIGGLMSAFTEDAEHPCDAYSVTFSNCVTSVGASVDDKVCVDCFDKAHDDVQDGTN